MARNFKKSIAFLIFLIGGIILGAFVSHLCKGVKYFDWLSFGQCIGFSQNKPAIIDLIIIKITFGFEMKFTVAQIFTVLISLITYSKTCKNL